MKDFLVDFRLTIDSAEAHLLQVSEQESTIVAVEGKWSPKEIIGHLIDSAANNHQRFVRAQFTEDLVFPGYEQERWVEVQHYNEESWDQLVQLWRCYNLHLLHIIANMPDRILTLPRTKHSLHQISWQTVAEDEAVTLEYLVRDYLKHLKNHLRQLGLSD